MIQELYDITLALTREEADLLLHSLETYALEMHNLSTYTDNVDALRVVELVDNIVCMITTHIAEQEPMIENEFFFN